MIDSIVNLVFRCPHRRLTRPMTDTTKSEPSKRRAYVVCLECGKQFSYDLNEMRVCKSDEPVVRHAGQ